MNLDVKQRIIREDLIVFRKFPNLFKKVKKDKQYSINNAVKKDNLDFSYAQVFSQSSSDEELPSLEPVHIYPSCKGKIVYPDYSSPICSVCGCVQQQLPPIEEKSFSKTDREIRELNRMNLENDVGHERQNY